MHAGYVKRTERKAWVQVERGAAQEAVKEDEGACVAVEALSCYPCTCGLARIADRASCEHRPQIKPSIDISTDCGH